MKNNFQKGSVAPLVILIVVILIAGGLYLWMKGRTDIGSANINKTLLPSQSTSSSTTTNSTASTSPANDISQYKGKPYILYMSALEGSVGTTVELRGVNLIDYQNDQYLMIENAKGQTASLGHGNPEGIADTRGWTIMKFTIPDKACMKIVDKNGKCNAGWLQITPGEYVLYVTDVRGSASDKVQASNKVKFTVIPNNPPQPLVSILLPNRGETFSDNFINITN